MKSGISNKSGRRARNLERLLALLVVLASLTGCSLATEGAAPSPEADRELTIAHTSWEESVALAHLTKLVLEGELGYEVKLESVASEEAFEGVASGEMDAFQGIWRPRHNGLISAHEDDIDMLGYWLRGKTRASLAAPLYMDVRRMGDLEDTEATRALVLDAEASGVGEIPEEVFERHDLEPSVHSDSSAMMEEVDRLYEAREPFVFLAYSPHWMNLRHDFVYLEDGEFLKDINRPSTLHSVTRANLAEEDPLAHALLERTSLTEYQIESLELAIHDAESPAEGARKWLEANESFIGSWAELAREAVS